MSDAKISVCPTCYRPTVNGLYRSEEFLKRDIEDLRARITALEAREARLVEALDIADQLIAFVQQDMDDLRDGQRQGVRGGKDSPRITITSGLLSQYRAARAELDAVKEDGDETVG